MIIEHAVLPITPGREAEFEAAFAEAKRIIAVSPGFRDLSLCRCVERPSAYLLLVHWDSIDDHMVGFRESAAYAAWGALLRPFYSASTTVEHYELVATA